MSAAQLPSFGAPRNRAFWARRLDYSWRPSPLLAAAAVVVAAAVYVTVAWSARSPALSLDEIVMVGNSRVVAGLPADWPLTGAGFMPGLAILMAPAWWFTDSAVVVYQFGVWITVALALLAIWPLSAIALRAGLSRPAGIIVSAVVVVAPSRALLANYLLAESGLLLTTAALVVAADRLWERHRTSDALWFGAAVGATVLFHGRGVGTAVAAGLWTLLLLRRDPKRAIVAGGSALILAIGAYLLYRGVTAEVIGSDVRVVNAFGDPSGRDVRASIASVIGQLWYPTLAWPAVVVTGGMAMIRWRSRGGMARFVLLAMVIGLIVSTLQLNPHQGLTRTDPWFYGRYMDQWWTVLAVVGLALLVRLRWPLVSGAAIVGSVVAGLGMLFITVPDMPRGMQWVDVHVLGISPWLSLDAYANGKEQSWGLIVLTGIVLALLVVVLGLIRLWLLPVVAVLWMWLSIAQDIQRIDVNSGDRDPTSDSLGLNLGLIPAGARVGIDQNLGVEGNILVFDADPRLVARVDSHSPPDGVDVVYVGWFASNNPPPGVKVLAPTVGKKFVVWVFLGEAARQLDAERLLVVPSQPPAPDSSATKSPSSAP